jgi:flagellar L-ring protein precursor FlgH
MDVASSTSMPRHLLLPVAVALLTLAGCASVVGDVRPFAPVAPMAGMDIPMASSPAMPGAHQQTGMASHARHSSGSIYANSGGGNTTGLRLFQDNKAREVGDLLTIVLVERTSSTSRAKTAVSKNSGLSLGAPVIAGVPVTHNGQSILQAEIEAGRDFNGSGDSTQSNRLDGEVTVSVVKALGNGNLLVSGQKQVRLNQGDELVQVQGIVRTADIGPDNRITSDRVGNAQIVYGGRGTLARSNAMGWLGRFFNSAAFPY